VDNQWEDLKTGKNQTSIFRIQKYSMCEAILAKPQMWEFGAGVFMYFSLLLSGSLLLGVCAAIYAPAIAVYLDISDELTASSVDGPVATALQGCAISRYIEHPTKPYLSTYDGVQRCGVYDIYSAIYV
jgi:hypothetical protein